MKIKLTLAYDGTNFCGYQVQDNCRTVQQVLEDALFQVLGVKVKTIASGRTDSGVHANGQVVCFDTNRTIPANKYSYILNKILPSDVKVVKSQKAKDDFHARYMAKEKTYTYKIYLDEHENPLKNRFSTHYPYKIDFAKIDSAIEIIKGEHDFKCFLASNSSVKSTVRTIYSIKVRKSKNQVEFSVTGNGFLYNMVRIIVGTLLQISEGKISLENLVEALETGNRTLVGKTMPPQGLCLEKVKY